MTTPAFAPWSLGDPTTEKRLIVGSLALECNPDLAECARTLLAVPDTITDCARFTAEFRRLFYGDENPSAAAQAP